MEKRRWYRTTWESKESYEELYGTAEDLKEAEECARMFGERKGYKGKRKTTYEPDYEAEIKRLKQRLYPPGHWIHG